MGLKRYIVFSLFFTIFLFIFLYSLSLGDYEFSMFGYTKTLPISIWIALPFLALLFSTYLHLFFYSAYSLIRKWAIESDHKAMMEFINSKLLEKNTTTKFKTKNFKDLANVLSQFNFIPANSETFTSTIEELNKTVNCVKEINNGKYIKNIKLNEDSKLFLKNNLNKIEEQVDFAIDVLKKPEKYSNEMIQKSFLKVLDDKPIETIKKLYKNIQLDKCMAKKLFEKDAKDLQCSFTQEEILDITTNLKYERKDYLALGNIYEKISNPDQIISIFEYLSSNNEEATIGYLNILCAFEMIDKVREVVSNSTQNDFLSFRALLDLKDAGKKYNLESLSLNNE